MVASNGNGQHPEQPRKSAGKPLFSPGTCLVTPGALAMLFMLGVPPIRLLVRHVSGDWGQIDPEDKGLNEAALRDGARIMSVYKFGDLTFWVITEADRSATTILLPDEY